MFTHARTDLSLSCPLPSPALPLNSAAPSLCPLNTLSSQPVQSSSSSPLFAPPHGTTVFLYAVRHFSIIIIFFKTDYPSEVFLFEQVGVLVSMFAFALLVMPSSVVGDLVQID